MLGQRWHEVENVPWRRLELRVIGAEARGDLSREHPFVVLHIGKTDGKGAHRLRGARLHERNDERRIGSTRQKSPHRDVGQHATPYGVAQQRVQRRLGFGVAAGHGVGDAAAGDAPEIPVDLSLGLPLRPDGDERSWGELLHPSVDGCRRRHIAPTHVAGHGIRVGLVAPSRTAGEGAELRGEAEQATAAAPVQGLYTQPVANQRQLATLTVPQPEGKHADQPLERSGETPFVDCRQKHLGIAAALEAMAESVELGAQLHEVVDLSVVADHEAAARRGHRLVAFR